MMMKRLLFVLPMLLCVGFNAARANWEYDGEYTRDGYYQDDGRHFIILIRGGMSYARGKIKSDVGELTTDYYFDGSSIIPGTVCGTACGSYDFVGYGNIGDLGPTKNYETVSFIGGAAIGWVLPWTPQWRFQVDWDYISESEYNVSPLFEGVMGLTGGDVDAIKSLTWKTGSVQSTVTTNVLTAMAIRDFYDGWDKPLRKLIPYAGVGLGYADSDTVLNFSDAYGDLSLLAELQNFGELDNNDILQFYSATKSSSNLAGVLTFGFSYGISESFFLDTGFRFIYIPRIKWALSNEDGSRSRDWFRADNMLYSNFVFGFRWEF